VNRLLESKRQATRRSARVLAWAGSKYRRECAELIERHSSRSEETRLLKRNGFVLADAMTLSAVTRRCTAAGAAGCRPPGHFG
jgi:hypothetical protein